MAREQSQAGQKYPRLCFNEKNKVVYVGIAKNLSARKAQHKKIKKFDKMVPITSTKLNRGEARAIEQAIIHNNPHLENSINSIAPSRALYNDAVQFGENWLTNNGHIINY